MDWLNTTADFVVGLLVRFHRRGRCRIDDAAARARFRCRAADGSRTDLVYAALTKTVGSWIHGLRGAVDWLVLRRLWLGNLPVAALTVAWLSCSPESSGLARLIIPLLSHRVSANVVRNGIAIMLLIVGAKMLLF